MAEDTFKTFKDHVAADTLKIYRNHSVRTKKHPVWFTALAFFEGRQWKGWSKVSNKLIDWVPKNLSRKMVVNKIQMIVTTFVAHYMRELPSFNVNPNSNTPDDVNAADLSQNVLVGEFAPKLEEILSDYFYWKYIIGTGIRGLFWNPSASAEVKLELGEGKSEIQMLPGMGEINEKVINPFNFYPVGGSTIKACTDIVHVEPLSLEEIEELYDYKANKEALTSEHNVGLYPVEYGINHKEDFEKKARVFHRWKKKSKAFPDGLHAIIINNKVIKYATNPYVKYGFSYPFFKSCAVPIVGQFWGKCPVEQLRRVQISYNYVYSIIIQTLERMGKLKWLIPKTSNIDKNALDTSVGEMVQYMPSPNAPAPTQANLSPIPYYYFQILEWLDKAFEDISGFHEVKSARLPTGANNPSGVMVNLLLEQDETRLAPAVKQYILSLKQESKLYLKMVQDLYDEDRILRIAGIENEVEILDFSGAALKGNNDVTVEVAPLLSGGRSSWENTVWKAVELNVIDARTAIQKLKLEHPKTILNVLSDEKLALRENIDMRQGKPRQVDAWHEDRVHLRIHENFLRTVTFEHLTDKIKQIFIGHREMHLKSEAEKFQQQLKAQENIMAVQGNPQQAGQAEQPR